MSRPCKYLAYSDNAHLDAVWHRWCDIDGKPHAIIERHDGSIEYVEAYRITFTDKQAEAIMCQMWDELEKQPPISERARSAPVSDS